MIKIIVVYHNFPNVRGFTTVLFNNIMPILRKKMEIEIVWVIHSNTKISEYKCEKNERVIRMNDYSNAYEILEKEKPDLIYLIPGLNTPDYAFSIAAKSLKIFRIGGEMGNLLFTKRSKMGSLAQMKTNKKDRTLQLQNFLSLNKFLINTQRKAGWNYFKIFRDFCSIFPMYFGSGPEFSPKFELDMHFLDSEHTFKTCTNLGFEKSKLIVTGNPSFDEMFQSLKTYKNKNQKDKKNILILTALVYASSVKKALSQRNLFVQETINVIPKDEFDVVVKIHPTYENLKDFTNIIGTNNSSVKVTQNTNLAELIQKADIIITPVSGTSAVCALIVRKPIIIWNVFNVENDALIQNELVLQCNDKKSILGQIRKAEKWLPTEEKIEQFMREFFYLTDGKASERIADGILNFLKQHKPHLF